MSAPGLLAALAAAPSRKPQRSQHEFEHQAALFSWARNPAVLRSLPGIALLEGSMNGVQLSKVQASKAKAAGMLAGAHDVRLPVPRGRWIGLSIELKYSKGRPSADQLRIGGLLEAEGWKVAYHWDWEDARAEIIAYLNLPRPTLTPGS
jgi:hypothetical protein